MTTHHLRFPNGRVATLRRLDGSDLCPVCGSDVGETFGFPAGAPDGGVVPLDFANLVGSFTICHNCNVEYGFDCELHQDDVIDGAGDCTSWRLARRSVLLQIGRTPELFAQLDRIAAEPDVTIEPHSEVPALVRSAAVGDEQQLRAAIAAEGVNLETRDWDGWTALHWAAATGRQELVRALLRAGADVSARNGRGETPLMWAAVRGHLSVVEELLAAGAELDAAATEGRAALEHPPGDCHIVPSPPAGQTALMWAASAGHATVIERLLSTGASPGVADAAAQSALMLASGSAAVEALLRGGADLSQRGPEAFTPLMFAARRADISAMRALIAAGADLHESSSVRTGHSALTMAIDRGSVEAVRFLLDAGADPNRPASDKMLPLECAARGTNEEIVAMLLDAGADVDGRGYRNYTALCSSLSECGGSREAVTRLLLQAGADVHVPGWKTQTPLMKAAAARRAPRVAMLLAAGARVTDRDYRGQTPLHFAVDSGHSDVVALLLAFGADPNAVDGRGETPISLARARKRPDMLVLLGAR